MARGNQRDLAREKNMKKQQELARKKNAAQKDGNKGKLREREKERGICSNQTIIFQYY